jgi:Xaa-Pro aminopeptidase
MGLVPHEAPRLSDDTPIRYPATHRDRPLEPGMVLSIETDLRLEGVGLIKLEDTVAVTAVGCEGYGDAHRDWIVV